MSQVAQWVKNLPAMQKFQEPRVRSLGQEDPLEEDMATHSSILAHGVAKSQTQLKRLSTHTHIGTYHPC